MSFGSFVKRNWFVILGIVTFFIGIISLILTCYFYKMTTAPPEPVFLLDPIRTIIFDSKRFVDTPLRVVRQNGDEIKGDLTSVRFYFWNNGWKSIKPSNILEPLVITLDDPNGEILDYKILKCSRNVVKPLIERNSTGPNRSLDLSFLILEHKDGLTCQVIYEGNPDASFSISGVVENADGISNMIQRRFWIEYCKKLPPAILFICMGVFSFVCIIVLKLPVFRPGIKVSRKAATIFSLLLICIPIILGIVVMIISVKDAQEKATYSVTQTIPKEIIP